jgi:hypothetical protein
MAAAVVSFANSASPSQQLCAQACAGTREDSANTDGKAFPERVPHRPLAQNMLGRELRQQEIVMKKGPFESCG